MTMAAPAHLVFDLDGTLVDSFPGIRRSAERAVRAVLPGTPLPDLRPHVGPPIREIFRRALGLEDEEVLEALEKEFRADYNAEGWKETVLFAGAASLLESLAGRGCQAFVLTNKPRTPTGRILDHLGIASHFAAVVSPDSATPDHPSKTAAARLLAADHRLDPARTWLVGDSRDDLHAARACGFRFIAARFGYGDVWREAPEAIAGFDELAERLQSED